MRQLKWSQASNGNWNGKIGEATMMVVAYHTDTFWWLHPKLPVMKGRSVSSPEEGMKMGQELYREWCRLHL